MGRTKWVRLLVSDLADAVRWAGQQNARQLSDFRYRVVNGRESVSFRMIPNYPIQIGTRDIVVVCHVRPRGWSGMLAAWAQDIAGTTVAAVRHAFVRPAAAPVILPGAAATPPLAAARDAVVHAFPLVGAPGRS